MTGKTKVVLQEEGDLEISEPWSSWNVVDESSAMLSNEETRVENCIGMGWIIIKKAK